jgi:geranylgeranyl pyrophosphate synthase
MTEPVDALLRWTQERIGERLVRIVEEQGAWPPGHRQVMSYPVRSGGKRMRPAFVYATAAAVGGTPGAPDVGADPPPCWRRAEPAALAVELVHTYSLVHDDLPAMDDDELRRGRPTVHVAYDEAQAVLAGDSLLTLAFGIAGGDHGVYPESVDATLRLRTVQALARAAGASGMVGGQSMDLGHEGPLDDLGALERLHRAKTGALFRFSCSAGAELAGADPVTVDSMARVGEDLGLAFQIADDLLDAGEDEPSYLRFLGEEGTRTEARRVVDGAMGRIEGFGEAGSLLRALALRCVERVY